VDGSTAEAGPKACRLRTDGGNGAVLPSRPWKRWGRAGHPRWKSC